MSGATILVIHPKVRCEWSRGAREAPTWYFWDSCLESPSLHVTPVLVPPTSESERWRRRGSLTRVSDENDPPLLETNSPFGLDFATLGTLGPEKWSRTVTLPGVCDIKLILRLHVIVSYGVFEDDRHHSPRVGMSFRNGVRMDGPPLWNRESLVVHQTLYENFYTTSRGSIQVFFQGSEVYF